MFTTAALLSPSSLVIASIGKILTRIVHSAGVHAELKQAFREEKLIDLACKESEKLERLNCQKFLNKVLNDEAVLLRVISNARLEAKILRIAYVQTVDEIIRCDDATEIRRLSSCLDQLSEAMTHGCKMLTHLPITD